MQEYRPNQISPMTRLFNLVWVILLVSIAIYAWVNGSLLIPGKGDSAGLLFTGFSLWLFLLAIVSAAINSIITIVDHYDKRDNERRYRSFSRLLNILGLTLVIAASSYQFVQNQKPPIVIYNDS
jgi:uncharacterized membrane protein